MGACHSKESTSSKGNEEDGPQQQGSEGVAGGNDRQLLSDPVDRRGHTSPSKARRRSDFQGCSPSDGADTPLSRDGGVNTKASRRSYTNNTGASPGPTMTRSSNFAHPYRSNALVLNTNLSFGHDSSGDDRGGWGQSENPSFVSESVDGSHGPMGPRNGTHVYESPMLGGMGQASFPSATIVQIARQRRGIRAENEDDMQEENDGGVVTRRKKQLRRSSSGSRSGNEYANSDSTDCGDVSSTSKSECGGSPPCLAADRTQTFQPNTSYNDLSTNSIPSGSLGLGGSPSPAQAPLGHGGSSRHSSVQLEAVRSWLCEVSSSDDFFSSPLQSTDDVGSVSVGGGDKGLSQSGMGMKRSTTAMSTFSQGLTHTSSAQDLGARQESQYTNASDMAPFAGPTSTTAPTQGEHHQQHFDPTTTSSNHVGATMVASS